MKYYLREGLLQRGRRTAANQADYDETHGRRLRLIRTLIEVGGLALADVRRVLRAIDDARQPLDQVMGVTHYALARPEARAARPSHAAVEQVEALISRLGWRIDPRAPARRKLAGAVQSLHALDWNVTAEGLQTYARAADAVAAHEIDATIDAPTRGELVERVVIGTVIFDRVLSALRLLAQEHHAVLATRRGRGPAVVRGIPRRAPPSRR